VRLFTEQNKIVVHNQMPPLPQFSRAMYSFKFDTSELDEKFAALKRKTFTQPLFI